MVNMVKVVEVERTQNSR